MKKFLLKGATVALFGTLMYSCIGSFGLTSKVLDWNRNLGGKFVNELVFIAFNIAPVYEVTVFADILVLNSIEFWTGSNPVAFKGQQEINGEKGRFIVKHKKDGYRLINKTTGVSLDLAYDDASKTWSAVTEQGQSMKLITLIDKKNALVYEPDGSSRAVALK
ncbi:MAG: DUF3332 domain-containing protein [Rikenellaceae bacterium]|jgi:hypothetical protein|nr:DUF3332 domain-containing protein [Rikenellaceae bacterium]